MANPSIALAVNREAVGQALAEARRHYVGDIAWLNAINRAALNIIACTWHFDGETLIIQSATSDRWYSATSDRCECKAFEAGRPCWHTAACRLLTKAVQLDKEPVKHEAACPMCGAQIEGREFYVGGRGYVYFDVCSGNGAHLTRKVD